MSGTGFSPPPPVSFMCQKLRIRQKFPFRPGQSGSRHHAFELGKASSAAPGQLGRLSTETQLRRLGLERVPDCDIHLVMSSGKSLQVPRSLRVPFRLPGCSGLSAPPAALGTRSFAGSPHCMKLGESVVSRPRSYTTVPLLLLIRIGGCVPLP